MTLSDANTCRRALREIGEITAVAVLQDSQMTDQEALQTIAAIAEWVAEEAPAEHADCGAVVRQLNVMTSSVDFDAMSDREALDMFSQVLDALSMTDGGRGGLKVARARPD